MHSRQNPKALIADLKQKEVTNRLLRRHDAVCLAQRGARKSRPQLALFFVRVFNVLFLEIVTNLLIQSCQCGEQD